MAQMVARGGAGTARTEYVTVADLLSRNAPVPVRNNADDDTVVISVDALLRREGRDPHANRRTAAAPRERESADAEERSTDRRTAVRRGAIAAGTLLAAGSVVGAAALVDVAPTSTVEAQNGGDNTQNGSYPGQGLLDGAPEGLLPPGAAVIDPAAVTDPLDPGTAAPTSWVPVAFPSAVAGVPTGTGAAAGDDSSGGSSSDSSSSSGSNGSSSGDNGSSGSSDGDSGGGGNGGTPSGSGNGGGEGGTGSGAADDDDDDEGLVGNTLRATTNTVGGLVDGVGSLVGGSDDEDSDDESRSSNSSDGDSDDSDSDSDGGLLSLLSSSSSAPQHDEDDAESSDNKDDDGDKSERSKKSDRSDEDDDRRDDKGDDDSRGLLDSVGDVAGSLLR